MNIPVSIDEDILFKYDPNSDYYTDECSSYTTENGTDILLSDRQEEFNENNMSLCENICNYVGYENSTKEAKCHCLIKPKQIVISDIINQPDILTYNNFTEKTLSSNMMSMKCFDTLFSKDGLLTNIGSYLISFTFILFLISGIIYYKCGYTFFEIEIKEILDTKIKTNIITKNEKIKNKIEINNI